MTSERRASLRLRLLDRLHFEKTDAEMVFKKTIRDSCNASGVEPRAGIGYMEFLEVCLPTELSLSVLAASGFPTGSKCLLNLL